MTISETQALAKRVDSLDRLVTDQEIVHVRTTIVVVERGDEPRYLSAAEALESATRLALCPPIRELRRFADLSVLIDPVKGTRKLRHRQRGLKLEAYDSLAAKARAIDIEITCHEGQVAAILSDAPITAVFGGNRSGKTEVEKWWLLRRWIKRGGPGATFWWVGPDLEKAISYGAWSIAGPMGQGGGSWPDAVFTGTRKITTATKAPTLYLIDGSVLAFMHAHHSGGRAGDNLKSANVRDAVVDELTAVTSAENWTQVLARVSQSGGAVCTASTRKRGHWSRREIDELVATAGDDAIKVYALDIFDNPWMAYAAVWKLFLTDNTLSRRTLEVEVLADPDPPARARAVVTKPRSLQEHFGHEVADTSRLWSEWDGSAIVTGDEHLWVSRNGQPVRLLDITAGVLRKHHDKPDQRHWVGSDFNYIGHSVVLKVYGLGASTAEALANRDSWTVLVTDEIEVEGSSLRHAEAVVAKVGAGTWVPCDPQGAMQGHAGRGSANSTDAGEFRRAGLVPYPANGFEGVGTDRRARQINRSDSINVLHRLQAAGRFYVHERCEGLIDALTNDKHTKGGGGSASDRRSGYSDAARYGCWPVFRHLVTAAASIET